MSRYYTPTDEPASDRLILIRKETGADGIYGHLQATIVRRAVSHHTDPDTNQKVWADENNATGYRHAEYASSKAKGHFVSNLAVRCQLNLRDWNTGALLTGPDSKPAPYGSEVTWKDLYSLDFKTVGLMHSTNQHITKQLDKIATDHGAISSDDFSRHVRRIAYLFGIKKFVTLRLEAPSNTSLAETFQYREFDGDDLSYTIDRLVESLATA